ncbi:hypothetical protein [Stenotrophomonas geniculata]|uniref:hypothetical protein n=1 Tax=Stenotrophomonas geniculata TaxID=86188 RepID=UPI002E780DCE|nr:hypothetical protein [Stenotrophomonas geniculata]
MAEFQYLTPCFENTAACNLDWAALSAIGGWAAAAGTVPAVVVALWSVKAQARVIKRADERTAVRLALAFGKELAFARRLLVAKLIDWNPADFPTTTQIILESFVAERPLPDLVFLRSCTDRLQGFKDEDAFALLSVLTGWQFFNNSPGLEVVEILHKSHAERERIAAARVTFGLELLDVMESTINKMADYYEGHGSVVTIAFETVPERAAVLLKDLRRGVGK